ncbi:MAG: OpgC domain-containing protein [Singulisphaera sp.]
MPCDFYLAGCHKWLRSGQPLGLGFCPRASRLARPLILCGQNSLPVYCAGGLLAIEGGQVLLMTGGDLVWQVVVNVLGWLGCIAVAAAWQWSVRRRREVVCGEVLSRL